MTILSAILVVVSSTNLFGQESSQYDEILFSVTGDTILKSGGACPDSSGTLITMWNIISRSANTDSLITLSYWDYPSKNQYSGFDSISKDTIIKYRLENTGRRINPNDFPDFRIVMSETKTNRGKKYKYDGTTRLKRCTVDFCVYYKDKLLLKIDDWQTMYYSENDEKIQTEEVVELFGWKMTGQERYLITIGYYQSKIKWNSSSTRHYWQVRII
ncbi:MAG: hypothetical protein GC178_07070 [Flavobacteriales bacterium]|nr:hypothetical protein [Flavobacteriales bacterium]